MSKLVMAGHSFGGSTAFKVGSIDKRVKVVLGMDSFMLPIKKEILDKKMKFQKDQSICMLNSGSYNAYLKILQLGYENPEYIKKIWD